MNKSLKALAISALKRGLNKQAKIIVAWDGGAAPDAGAPVNMPVSSDEVPRVLQNNILTKALLDPRTFDVQIASNRGATAIWNNKLSDVHQNIKNALYAQPRPSIKRTVEQFKNLLNSPTLFTLKDLLKAYIELNDELSANINTGIFINMVKNQIQAINTLLNQQDVGGMSATHSQQPQISGNNARPQQQNIRKKHKKTNLSLREKIIAVQKELRMPVITGAWDEGTNTLFYVWLLANYPNYINEKNQFAGTIDDAYRLAVLSNIGPENQAGEKAATGNEVIAHKIQTLKKIAKHLRKRKAK